MPKELAKQYAPQGTEDRIYQNWCDKGYFHTQIDRSKKPFTIVMPPPNVTGQLHMGHAMDETWQDILTRYKRMQGYAALWVPGTDHASIATEAKVVAKMREEGLTKEMVGRDGFLERAWDWKNTYGNRIVSQLKKLGCSCDWQRERFTMDEGCSDAVKEVFVRLYNEGLIYRGNRMVNWCPHCNTSISDAEVEYEAKEGSFWHLLYPVKETGEMLELATLGAKVLHNRSVEMAKRYHVNLEVLSSFTGHPGTIVKEVVKNMEKSHVSGVAKDKDVARLALVGLQDRPGVAFKIFSLLANEKINVDIILQSIGRDESKDISFTVVRKDVEAAQQLLKEHQEALGFDSIEVNDRIAKVSIVGAGMINNPGVAASMFEALYDAGINISMISTSEIKVSVLVDETDADRAVQVIHDKFFALS